MDLFEQPLPEITREFVQEYLDGAIDYWRESRDNAAAHDDYVQALIYVDAFQSARVSLLGEELGGA